MNFVSICGQCFNKMPMTGGDILNFELLKKFFKEKNDYLIINDITVPCVQKFLKCQIVPIRDLWRLNQLVQKHLFLVPFAFVNSAVRISRILKRNFNQPLVLYSPGDFICNIFPIVLYKRKYPDSKIVVRIHHINKNPFERKENSFLASLFSFIFQRSSFYLIRKHADLVFLLNQDVKSSLVKMGFDSKKLIILGAGINITEIKKIEEKRKRKNKVIFLGRLSPTKGIFDLPEIWPIVIKEVNDAQLILIGASNDIIVNKLKSEFFKMGILETVEFKGFIKKSEDIYRILKTGKVFILPSYEEGWGIVIFEAIACGLSPVVYNLPVFKEIFGESIQTVSLGNKTDFSQKIVEFLKNEKLRKENVLQLNKKIEKFDINKILEREYELIKKISAFN